jgi:hypothetical protein
MNVDHLSRREFMHKPVGASLALALSGSRGNLASPAPALEAFNIFKFGAKGDGRVKDTRAIQQAIDACCKAGGGTVYFPPGKFLSGSLHLRTNVALHLDHAAGLVASADQADFDPYETLGFKNASDRETSFFHHALIWAENAERIAITGHGTIDGNRQKRGGPKPIALKRCRFVDIQGITIRNSPNYCISLLGTDFVSIDGVTILNGYSDGIDPDCCRHVRIANCHIESWDDAIVPKASFSLGERRSTENLTVANCLLATNCNAFKLGTESGGDFRNIAITNCAFFSRQGSKPPISGISLLTVDGGAIDGVAISNISMTGARCPIFLRLGNRGRDLPRPTAGVLRNVLINNIIAANAEWPCLVAGIPGHPIEGVTFSDLRVTFAGGGTKAQAQSDVPENVASYPTADMFKAFTAYGLCCRHARDLRIVGSCFKLERADERPAARFDDTERLVIDSLDASPSSGNQALLAFHHVRDALIRGCMPRAGTAVFLGIAGSRSRGISLIGNDLSRVGIPIEASEGVDRGAVVEIGNRKQ